MTNPLDLAADRLRGRWQQGALGDFTGDGPVCANGAILCVVGREQTWAGHSMDCLLRAIHQHSSNPRHHCISAFNDDPSTTEEDVLLMFKRASALWYERYGDAS